MSDDDNMLDKNAKVIKPPPTPRQAYEDARAEVCRAHSYTYDTPRDTATCACGEVLPAGAITMHVEALAEQAGRAAREEAVQAAVREHEAREKKP